MNFRKLLAAGLTMAMVGTSVSTYAATGNQMSSGHTQMYNSNYQQDQNTPNQTPMNGNNSQTQGNNSAGNANNSNNPGMMNQTSSTRTNKIYQASYVLNQLGVVQGNNSDIDVDSSLDNAQMVTLLVRMLGEEDETTSASYSSSSFDDVSTSDWYFQYVEYAYKNGLIDRDSDDDFNPDSSVTLTYLVEALLNALDYSESEYEDDPVEFAEDLGWDTDVDDEDAVTRGEAFELMYEALQTSMNGNSGVTLGNHLGVMNSNGQFFTSDGAILDDSQIQQGGNNMMQNNGYYGNSGMGNNWSDYADSSSVDYDEDLLVDSDDSDSDESFDVDDDDQSAIRVTDGASYTLDDSDVTKTGDSSDLDDSLNYGLNAAIVVDGDGALEVTDTDIDTDGEGASGLFAYGDGADVTLSSVSIDTSDDYSQGLAASDEATVEGDDLDISTDGDHSAAVATSMNGGTISLDSSTLYTSGDDSPGIYSTGDVTLTDSYVESKASEMAVLDGDTTISLDETDLYGEGDSGIKFYTSDSDDAEAGTSKLTMSGGSIEYNEDGPLFYLLNTYGVIKLEDVDIDTDSDVLISLEDGDTEDSVLKLTAEDQTLEGDIEVDDDSSLTLDLSGDSYYKGQINEDETDGYIGVYLDDDSEWSLTGDSYITVLVDDDEDLDNIDDNGYDIYYDPDKSANSWLDGDEIELNDGGSLIPID